MVRSKLPAALYWLPTGVFAFQYLYSINTINGRSMQPTLNPNSSPQKDVALFNRFSIHTQRQYNRNDIVALRSPDNPHRTLVKRIIAVEGDLIKTLPPYPDLQVRVPPGHIWVEGDEPFHSDDSSRFGPVPLALIDSKLILILWPLNRFGPLPTYTGKNGQAYRDAMAVLKRETPVER